MDDKAKAEVRKERKRIIEKTRIFNSKVKQILLTRGGSEEQEELTLTHVVARHWRLLCAACPELLDAKDLQELFIEDMLNDWEIEPNSADWKELKEAIQKIIHDIEHVPSPEVTASMMSTLRPVSPTPLQLPPGFSILRSSDPSSRSSEDEKERKSHSAALQSQEPTPMDESDLSSTAPTPKKAASQQPKAASQQPLAQSRDSLLTPSALTMLQSAKPKQPTASATSLSQSADKQSALQIGTRATTPEGKPKAPEVHTPGVTPKIGQLAQKLSTSLAWSSPSATMPKPQKPKSSTTPASVSQGDKKELRASVETQKKPPPQTATRTAATIDKPKQAPKQTPPPRTFAEQQSRTSVPGVSNVQTDQKMQLDSLRSQLSGLQTQPQISKTSPSDARTDSSFSGYKPGQPPGKALMFQQSMQKPTESSPFSRSALGSGSTHAKMEIDTDARSDSSSIGARSDSSGSFTAVESPKKRQKTGHHSHPKKS